MSTTTERIQLAQGLFADLPALMSGELAWPTDLKELFAGDGTGVNIPLRAAFSKRLAKAATYTVVAADVRKMIEATAGTWSLNLTAAATLGDGFTFMVFNSGSGVITIDPNAAETIRDASGSATTKTLSQGEAAIVMCNGTDFLMLKVALAASTLDALSIHGADIASAATVNLDSATGDLVDVTGTTTITAITLTEGRTRTVRFTGILALTHGASLVLPTAANITTAAGDFAILRGYAAGVVRCVAYSRSTGAALSSGATTAFVNGSGDSFASFDASAVPYIQFKRSGVAKGTFGIASGANSIVTGTAAGDLAIKADGSGNMWISLDNGTTAHLQLTAGAYVFKSQASTDANLFVNCATNTKNSVINFQLGGTGKMVVGAVGAANAQIAGTVQNDSVIVASTNLLISSDNGASAALKVVSSTGAVLALKPTAGLGYGTGAGGTVVQATSKSTGVTLNKVCGAITLNGAALAATTSATFTLTNSAIAATDVVNVSIASGATVGSYFTQVDAVAAGSCQITLRNYSAGSLSEAVVLNFAVTKAVTS